MADMRKKALVVGISLYERHGELRWCVSDALSVNSVLERHGDGSKNFDVQLLTCKTPPESVKRSALKDAIKDLFNDDSDVALLYFAGHGHIESTGGYLLASDSGRGDEGVALGEILDLANKSPARNKIIVLDSCYSGAAGSPAADPRIAHLSEGLTILTASTDKQEANEQRGSGVFTALFVDALGGAAANLVGEITPGSVYAHIDQSLGSWEQRPVFKTNVKSFVSLRKVPPALTLEELRRLTKLFPSADFEFPLDPSFEPLSDHPDPANTETFSVLQKYNRVNLLVPVGAPHMWHAAMESKSCKLTVLGQHYWRLVDRGRI